MFPAQRVGPAGQRAGHRARACQQLSPARSGALRGRKASAGKSRWPSGGVQSHTGAPAVQTEEEAQVCSRVTETRPVRTALWPGVHCQARQQGTADSRHADTWS